MDILRPVDWGKEVISGVTLRNNHLFPPYGLTLGKTERVNEEECENHRKAFADAIGVSKHSLQFQKQVHGAFIKRIYSQSEVTESDGMITNERGIVLCVLLADCCGVLLYDERNHSIGAIHSGWRGTHIEIPLLAVEAMKIEFGTKPEELKVYLSPCASGNNYEVKKDVAELFDKGITQKDETHFLFDNRAAIKDQLIRESGISPKNITESHECTISDKRFHSFRRDGKLSGRIATFIGLK